MAHVPSIDDSDDGHVDPTDFTPYIDPVSTRACVQLSSQWSRNRSDSFQAPVALDIRSPMDLVYECFAKLGLRYICVLREGRYAGVVWETSRILTSVDDRANEDP